MRDDRAPITKDSLVPLGLAVMALCAAISGTWYVADVLNKINVKLDAAVQDRWSVTDMERWALRLERGNHGALPAFYVPDVRGIRDNQDNRDKKR